METGEPGSRWAPGIRVFYTMQNPSLVWFFFFVLLEGESHTKKTGANYKHKKKDVTDVSTNFPQHSQSYT